MYSDASLSGWGAVFNEVTSRGPWTIEDSSHDINELELLGAFFALDSFGDSSRGITVHLFLDNTTTIAYINKTGGIRSRALNEIAKDLIALYKDRDVCVEAFHLRGTRNVIADLETRAATDAGDFMLDRNIFLKINLLCPRDIDFLVRMECPTK